MLENQNVSNYFHCLDIYMVKSYWSFLLGWSLFNKHHAYQIMINLAKMTSKILLCENNNQFMRLFLDLWERHFKSIIRRLLGTLNKTELWFDCRVIKPALLLTPRFYITRKLNGLRWFEPAGSNTACTVILQELKNM